MRLSNIKLFLGIFILFAFISIGVFGLIQFSHANNHTPIVNCLYANGGYSICSNILNHIKNWQQFSNVIFSSLFVFSFLVLGLVLYILSKQNFLNQKQYLYNRKHLYKEKLNTSKSRIIKWLSLFENSPSFSLKA